MKLLLGILFLAFTTCHPLFALNKIPNSMLLGPTTLTSVSGTLGIANGGTGQTTALPAFNALSPLTTKGDLLIWSSGDNTRKAVGTDGQVLTAKSADVTGVVWSTPSVSTVTGTLAIANGGTGQTTATASFDALAPTTTKGDLIVRNSTTNIRVPVGSNNQVLVADSTQASGVKWAAPTGGVAPTVQRFLTVGTFTYTKSAGATYIKVQILGGGGGGGGGGSGATTAGNGGNSFYDSLQANGGTGGNTSGAGGVGGTVITNATLTPIVAMRGNSASGTPGNFLSLVATGTSGASGPFGGSGASSYIAAGSAAIANSGAGGGGGASTGAATNSFGGPGGGAGGYIEGFIFAPNATATIVVGAGGTAGAAAPNGTAGGAGGSGMVVITEYYN